MYGDVAGVAVGSIFKNRRELFEASVHRDIQRGITGRREDAGAESIVLSNGYEDDVDLGTLVFYTGDGGRDEATGKQIANQSMAGRNLTLAKNVETRQPVRVIRSVSGGFRYDGLFAVEQAWTSPGKSGFIVCRYRLRKLDAAPIHHNKDEENRLPSRRQTTMYRLVRDTELSSRMKRLYECCCQICGVRVETAAGPYAEAAHILPLGEGYDGPDIAENILCLCPNDHVRLDHGSLFVLDDHRIIDAKGDMVGKLTVHPQHRLDQIYFKAHRRIFGHD